VRSLIRCSRILGTRSETLPGSGLLVEDDRILAVLRPAEVRSASADQVLDLEDATLLAGLIDAHVHLSMSAGPTHDAVWSDLRADAADGVLAYRAAANAAAALQAGITTVRDLGDHQLVSLGLRRAERRGLAKTPNLLLAGAPITTPGGHLHPIGLVVRGVDQVRSAVRRLAEAGVDWIKVMASGGNMTAESDGLHPQFVAEELRALVEEAHELGKKVAAHALCTHAIRLAVEAGVDTLEHGLLRSADGQMEWNQAIVEQMAERGISVTATLGGYLRALMHDHAASTSVRSELAAFWDPYQRLRAAGVRVIAASDAGVRLTPIGDPAGMLRLLCYGFDLSFPDALAMLTTEPALALGLADRGWLGPCARADVLAVRGELEGDARRLADVEMVMLGGRIVRRPSTWQHQLSAAVA